MPYPAVGIATMVGATMAGAQMPLPVPVVPRDPVALHALAIILSLPLRGCRAPAPALAVGNAVARPALAIIRLLLPKVCRVPALALAVTLVLVMLVLAAPAPVVHGPAQVAPGLTPV
jgi:hypothetical protein